jgi:hypothetical protein
LLVDTEGSGGQKEGGRNRWLPHLTKATTWLLATVAAAVIGVVVPGLLGGWLPGVDGDDDGGDQTQTTSTRPSRPSVPRSRLVSSERVGLYNVELDGSAQGAINVFGEPTSREPDDLSCVLKWAREGVEMDFYNLGGEDPCVYGRFCWAHVTGGDWATSKGLAPKDRTRRMLALYPAAKYIPEQEIVRRYVIEPPTAPCGTAKGGLEAWTASGKVFALRVSFAAGGD